MNTYTSSGLISMKKIAYPQLFTAEFCRNLNIRLEIKRIGALQF
jgi:hypothetical protein